MQAKVCALGTSALSDYLFCANHHSWLCCKGTEIQDNLFYREDEYTGQWGMPLYRSSE